MIPQEGAHKDDERDLQAVEESKPSFYPLPEDMKPVERK